MTSSLVLPSLVPRLVWLPRLLFVCVLFASQAAAEGRVVTLSQSDFYPTINKGPRKRWFVKFYAEWCGHCKRLRPIWDELSEWADESIGIAKVDATKNRDLADKFGVRGYPNLVYIHDGSTYYKYSGGRTLEDFQAFLNGGYREGTPEPLPEPPGLKEFIESTQKRLKKEYFMLEEDFYHIMSLRKNAMAAFLMIGAIVGCVFGCLIGAVCCRCGNSRKEKSKTD